ncbi:MAG: DUF47 domain-containing protein [Planctomycetota bacterium]|jgi:predicted phosphate transport protein (TIGR00153 family)
MIFWRRQAELENAIEDYLQEAQKCLEALSRAIECYFAEGLSSGFEELVDQVRLSETESDSKRREIESMMYGQLLIPEHRGDILGLLEALDLVPNKAESVSYQIWLQDMVVPAEYADEIKGLVQANVASFQLLCEATRHLFTDVEQVLPTVEKICEKERESDRIERRLIKSIFDSPGDKADKILLKELILEIGAMSDRAENASDRLRIIAIKLPK